MAKQKKILQRRLQPKRGNDGTRDQRKLFIIGVEGETEYAYFSNICDATQKIRQIVVSGKHSNADSIREAVAREIQKKINTKEIRSSDEAWIVLDRDQGENDEAIATLYEWANKQKNRFIALSNPDFEYWLILHFEDGIGICTKRETKDRIRMHISEYSKGNPKQLPKDWGSINQAINRAVKKHRIVPKSVEEFDKVGGASTSVHHLLEHLYLEVKKNKKNVS